MSRPLVGNLHAGDEWIDIASMETLYRIYERYLESKLVTVKA
jgi:succinyl-diaminopimelate desuccinylase